ncbi:hypothetical protein Lalb_Chr02g0151951 [Lupinus albus]|uniref:Uncharacterized protein n=1 Tax=Lupinus albus TaxID=3870 RepID=A0A6A4QZP8_LUPAL|nr:hypothetical protein Lalb_Chr02g0151951 [Lupinus albus]
MHLLASRRLENASRTLHRCCVEMGSTYNGTILWINSLVYIDGNLQEIKATPKG